MLTFGLVESVKTEVRPRLNILHSGIFLGGVFPSSLKGKPPTPPQTSTPQIVPITLCDRTCGETVEPVVVFWY
jgi:hypothetical protein